MRTWNFPRRKERRHEEAVARQEEYDKLTNAEKLDLARSRRGSSQKEISRITRPKGAEPKRADTKRKKGKV